MSPKLARPIGQPIAACVALTAPALVLRLGGVHPPAAFGLLAFGAAVVAASFLLAWAAEAARLDIAGPLAIAILAVIAVLPEYAVDLYFSYTAGHNPDYVQYAAANMTGSNRLLLGLGWPVVVIISLWVASRRSGRSVRELVLQSSYRTELGFLFIASIVAFGSRCPARSAWSSASPCSASSSSTCGRPPGPRRPSRTWSGPPPGSATWRAARGGCWWPGCSCSPRP